MNSIKIIINSCNPIKKYLFLIFLFFVGCTNLYNVPEVIRLNILVKYPAAFNDGKPIANATVKIVDIQTNRIYENKTDATGLATFAVKGGNFNITVSVSEEHEIEIEGYPAKKTILFNGSLNGQVITINDETVTVTTSYSIKNEDFIIKELYVSASTTPEEKTYGADKFIEIYNNSDHVLYADGLCYGAVFPVTTDRPSPFVDDGGNLLNRCPVWSFVPIVPGSGNEHPVQPGKSIVIALSGLNHKNDPNGNPNSIDLSGANWEMFVESGRYVDVPSVPNMLMQNVSRGGANAIALSVSGQVSIIFRLPSNDIEAIFSNSDNYMIQPGGSTNCFMVPWGWIIDGVENVRPDDKGVYKRLRPEIDLGYIYFRGSYEGVSIRRKVKEVINGRVVYQDTNNSSEDFLTDQVPQPGIIQAY